MKDNAEANLPVDPATGPQEPGSPWQRAVEADGWFGLILPGILALSFILIVFLAVMAGDRALVASARETNAATLNSVLASTMQRFEEWAVNQERHAAVWAGNELVQQSLEDLLATPELSSIAAAPAQLRLRTTLGPWLTEYGFRGFYVLGANGVILSSVRNSDLGQPSPILSLVDTNRLRAGRKLSMPLRWMAIRAGRGWMRKWRCMSLRQSSRARPCGAISLCALIRWPNIARPSGSGGPACRGKPMPLIAVAACCRKPGMRRNSGPPACWRRGIRQCCTWKSAIPAGM